ncbi:alanine--tRNA ligase [Saccharospirillum sp. MSK14-1]|uniref:alanine--tRNA ligase n=1 Tax=Saccharospirillum sp. MSK14-1 TaxID=1897632 RepID=UPI000D38D043|nr:alanine--tRNA ligase [Saccharospirillum sp. MSK14-1]PTY37156.1 alanine--tRNA ligase [Saccharospirillum sp. MSK14-1]
MKTSEIRRRFLDYFVSQGHAEVESGSLVPGNDPTLLFTNAGMVPFKDVFLGQDKRSYSRAVTSQRCVRAGGKHNDLENVGYTARHHTFFEMLGNFSFGDYFKHDAIRFAWTFLTQELGLPKERLWVTVYHDDDEAADIWINEIGVPADRLSRLGEKDNFWSMGDTGPCGPSSEIFYDHGPEVPGGPPGSPDDDLDRYIEIWNLVFMQFDQAADGTRTPLPRPSIDTGMGLERLAAVLQHVHSNYEIDLFQNLIRAVMDVTGCDDVENRSLRVIADHIRSTAFLIIDGVVPSNEGRGYVLRRIMRRAIRHGYKLGQNQPFFHQLIDALGQEMGEAYPQLLSMKEHLQKVILLEEEQFARTLDNGMQVLETGIAELSGKTLPGELVFRLYDTYGFPADLTADVARERDLEIDMAGFEEQMEAQRQRARSASKFRMDKDLDLQLPGSTDFLGYDSLVGEGRVIKLLQTGESVDQLNAGDDGVIILDRTPFYAESGGQIGDHGQLSAAGVEIVVDDCTKLQGHHLHQVRVQSGSVTLGDTLQATVARAERENTMRHHSATHLLHAALREVLGDHVQQRGSLVTYDKLRFDFSHLEAVTAKELRLIEQRVNEQVFANTEVSTELMPIEQAKAKGAMALFGEKYDDEVRVLTMGVDNYSIELCGGTHVRRTGDIGLVRLVSETGIASGVRRIEAVAGPYALADVHLQEDRLDQVSAVFKTGADQVVDRASQAQQRVRELERTVEQLKTKLASSAGTDLAASAVEIGGIKVLAAVLDGADAKTLRTTLDQLKDKLQTAAIVLAAVNDGKVQLAAGVTKDSIGRLKAGDLVNQVASQVGGKGGGKPDMAMAGGSEPEKLADALASVPAWVEQQLG